MTILSASRRHASRFSAGNGTPLQLRARGLLEELFPRGSEVEPLFTPEQVRELQVAAQAAEAAAAAAAAKAGGKRKGRKRKASGVQKAGSATSTAAAAAAVAALRASARSPALVEDASTDPEDNLGLMSDLLLPDDPHLESVLGSDLAAAPTQPPPPPAAAAASKAKVDPQQHQADSSGAAAAGTAPATGPAAPLSSTEQQQQQQSHPALVLEVPAITHAESGALLLSSPAAEAGSSSPTTDRIITEPLAEAAATDGTGGKLQPPAAAAATAAAAAAGDDDLMAVDQILADLAEDAMLGSSGQQQLHAPGRDAGFSFQALLLSADDPAERLGAAHAQLLPPGTGQGLHACLPGYGTDLLQLQGSAHWSPGGPLLNRPAGDTHVLPPGSSSSSRATADFSTPHQQQMLMSLIQQEGVPAEASARAQERSHRKERKRLKKLQKLQMQQQVGVQSFPASYHQGMMLLGPVTSSGSGGASMPPQFMPPSSGIPPHLSYQLQQQGLGVPPDASLYDEALGGPGPWRRHPGSSGGDSFGRLTPNVLASAVAADLANHGWPPPRLRRAGVPGHTLTTTPPAPPPAAAGAGLLEQHSAAAAVAATVANRFAPYSLVPGSSSSRPMGVSRPSSIPRQCHTPNPASLGRAASFSELPQFLPSVDAGDSGSPLPAAAAATGFGRSKSVPELVLAGVPVGEAAAEAVGGQQLGVLQGIPVSTAHSAAVVAAGGGGSAAAAAGAVEPYDAGAAGVDASSTEQARIHSANDPTTAAEPVPEPTPHPPLPAGAATAKDMPALTSPQGVSPSGSCSTSNTLTHPHAAAGAAQDTHARSHTHLSWQQPMLQQQQQQDALGQLFPPQQWTTQQHTTPTAASLGLLGGPWLHTTVGSALSLQQQQQQQVLSPPQATSMPLMHQLSASDATLLAAAAAAGMPPPHSFTSPTAAGQQPQPQPQPQPQHQQHGGQKRKGRGRGGQAPDGASGSAQSDVVNGGMDLAASSRLLRTSSGKVLRMLTHPVTGKPLLLGPAVDAKTSRLGNTTLGAPAPQLFGHILHPNRVPQPSTAAPPPPQATAGPGYPAHGNSYQQGHLQPWMGSQRTISSGGGYGAWNAAATTAPAAAAAAAAAGGGMSGLGQYPGLPGLSHLQPQFSPASVDAQAYADTVTEYIGLGAASGYSQPGLRGQGGMFVVGVEGHQGWVGGETGAGGVPLGGLRLPDPAAGAGAYVDDGLLGYDAEQQHAGF